MPTINGTLNADTIHGSNERDSIYGFDGDDTIYAGDGDDELNDDWINAGPGNDVIYGGAGGDMIYDESGDDIVYAGAGRDLIYGSSGIDYYDGGAGYDSINYHSAFGGVVVDLTLSSGHVRSLNPNDAAFVGVDTLYNIEYIGGTNFGDYMVGNSGDNRFWGADGNDTLVGGGGNDELLGGLGDDLLDGGEGFDQAIYAGVNVGVTVSLAITVAQNTGHGFDTLIGIESLYGTYYSDVLIGNDKANLLIDFAGADRFYGGGGADELDAGQGDDLLSGEGGADILIGGSGNDSFTDTAAGLSGDTIRDFSGGDRIIVTDANIAAFSISLTGNVLTFTGGVLTLGHVPQERLVARAAADGGVQITIGGSVVDDFNGDGRSDILLRHSNGTITNWLSDTNGGGSFVSNQAAATYGIDAGWQVAGTGDFNFDGRTDLLLRHDNGWMTEWLGNAAGGFVDNGAVVSTWVHPDWQVASTGDFNGDGRSDALLRHANGWMTEWLGQADGSFSGNGAVASNWIHTDWQITGTGDFNGDGRDDVLLRHTNGWMTEWLGQADGSFSGNGAVASYWVHPDWQVTGTGDFNGDGRSDLLLRHANGWMTEWLGQANGSFSDNGAAASDWIHPEWQVAATGDYNGDGRDDLLLRHTDGTITEWLAQGDGSFFSNHLGATYSLHTSWEVQGPDIL